MKKTLAMLLVLVMAVSCCSVIFASAETVADPFWITHYDEISAEGAGIILTEATDWDGAWADHYAFKPIEGVENGYELVDFSYGTIADGDDSSNGHGATPAIPEGGFVYSTSIGNNYTSDGIDTTRPDYVNDSCNAQISRSRTWKVGDQFIITGLDLEGKVVPTTTPDKKWYEDGYVCTATIAPYDPSNPPAESTDGEESKGEGEETSEPETTEPESTYEDDIAALVGADRESADFAIDLKSAIEDGVMTVTLTVKDIKEGVQMHALMAHLYYDTERLELTNKINKDMSVECATALPYGDDSEWENLTKVSKDEEGMIDISFVVAVDPDQYIDADHPIVLTFTFKVLEGADEAGVYIPTASVTSKFVGENTESSKDYVGNGTYTVATTKTTPTPDDSSSTTPSEETSSGTAKPGDAGILVFAILGILAVAGTVTVIKVRH